MESSCQSPSSKKVILKEIVNTVFVKECLQKAVVQLLIVVELAVENVFLSVSNREDEAYYATNIKFP